MAVLKCIHYGAGVRGMTSDSDGLEQQLQEKLAITLTAYTHEFKEGDSGAADAINKVLG